MSGLCGLVDFGAPRVEPAALRALAESAAYRAPAGIGYRFLGEAGLAHLALHSGHAEKTGLEQPLLDPRRQVCAVFDGRLDNRSELIARLEPAAGADASDVGLLLAAYLEWGEACTDHLLGDFAFAVWDAGRRRLLCAVDPLGIKPLHYARAGSLICFASDAVQVLGHPAVPDGYNEVEIAAYLAGRCEDPERSFFAAVHKLAPGRRLIATDEGLRVERYWSPPAREIRYGRDDDYAAHFLEILQRAVTDRLRGAGKFVGIAMSGGLDSTSVAALAHRAPGPGARGYTFAFDRLTECDERSYSRAMTGELGLDVEPIAAERLWRLESPALPPFSPDTPFTGWRTCYQEIFRRMVARGSRVLLMGHGGDDLLRGSSLIYAERLRRGDLAAVQEIVRHARGRKDPVLRSLYQYFARPHLPAGADRLLRSTLGRREGLPPAWIHPDFARRTRLAGRLKGIRKISASPARQDVHANLVGVPWYWRLANWHDRNAASFGIEVRHPFLDRRLCEYVLAIPGEQLFRLDSHKNLLRRSMTGILPEVVRVRPGKTKFARFLDLMLRERAGGEIAKMLKAPLAVEMGIVNGDELRSAFSDFLNGKMGGAMGALWHTILLEIWLRRCETVRGGRRPEAAASSPVAA
ncbi:MAG TPA: asparagine synthase-related protein [Thermoanaerobaculia bacterium]|jgi:asparagine synthase (glutamine-hydrolysing)